jgi:outer membrane protein
MRNGLLILNGILVIAVGFLLYKQFNIRKSTTANVISSSDTSTSKNPFRIAYFEMDSIAANFNLVKELKDEMGKRESAINTELDRLDKGYREKVNEYQQKAQTMSQVQSEMATQDLMQTQDQIKNRKQQLDQEYSDFVMRRQNDIKAKIENFLKEYNKTKNYSYIVSYEQGLFYYKDSTYDITADVLRGLNDAYKTKKD